MSKSESDGDSGVEILENKPYDDPELGKGQYTHKIYHLGRFLAMIAPASALRLDEQAWNGYPHCKTVLTVRGWMDGDLESFSGGEVFADYRALNLSAEQLKQREVVYMDIANDPVDHYDEKNDPAKVRSEKTGRGPLTGNWKDTCEPVMCCYKTVIIKFKVFGLETKTEHFIAKWFGMTIEDIRRIEEEAKKELNLRMSKNNLTDGVAAPAPA
ncbi:Bet v1-like protein [Rozella allomycis CSF55]|uniref:Bet v1-like protein n=1 Tax=Rozella allomycis (strain CSF55) TaxID=988480 RepID=A0A075AQ64_ROZAC|nr:START-like domain-containing protein [Rozella allomycis CSF55]RKP19179.1 Bet v1-like protein [Rozella allomycis CSF55]|eukprot:EPZ32386.1 START-like domain-containing protein [Rozella allomycis CSF55]